MTRPRHLLVWAALVLSGSAAAAELADAPAATARARSAPVVTVYFENDVVSGTDEHYTNGLKVSWLSADLVDWGQHGWRQTCIELLPFVNRPDGQKNIGFAFGQNMYTPRDTHAHAPDPAGTRTVAGRIWNWTL